MELIIAAIIGVICTIFAFIFGIILGKRKQKTIGTLYLNRSNPTKEFFEFHFKDDLSTFEKKSAVSFNLVVR